MNEEVKGRSRSAKLGRLFVYNVQLDENRGIWAIFRIRETNQELNGEGVKLG